MKESPFWWEAAPLTQHVSNDTMLPRRADVVIVGSGYTGLHAGLQTALAGRHTVVLEANALGSGCSTRNGGQVSNSLKPDFSKLAKQHGEAKARAIYREGFRAIDFLQDFITSEAIDCDWHRPGRFVGAHSAAAFRRMQQSASKPHDSELSLPSELIAKSEQSQFIDSDFYQGGQYYPDIGSLQPAKYHRGLLNKVINAGVDVFDHTAVTEITRHKTSVSAASESRDKTQFVVETPRGQIVTDNVIIATNGYTSSITPWQQRRVIPIGSYIIATEPMSSTELDRYLPTQAMICDSRHVVFYYRKDPSGQRIIFGGRVALQEQNDGRSAAKLQRELSKIFPSLRDIGISHAWHGFVAFSFDSMPHIGQADGLHYAMGYCGSGVSLSSYFGMRVGQQVLGQSAGNTALDNIKFPTKPLYTGNPWFLAPSIAYYKLKDAIS